MTWERSGHRHLGLSLRHRYWGVNCPATDIDFVLIEYDRHLAVAAVEYTRSAYGISATGANADALVTAFRPGLPVFRVAYTSDCRRYCPAPMNLDAVHWLPNGGGAWMAESRYVELLYRLRGRPPPSWLFDERGLLRSEQLWREELRDAGLDM